MQDYLYSVIGFIAIAVQLIINFQVMFVPDRDDVRKTDRLYRWLMLAIFAYYNGRHVGHSRRAELDSAAVH